MHKEEKRIYMDYAATTPVDSLVLEKMMPYFNDKFGNPGSAHVFGQEASMAVEEARSVIARSLHCQYREIFFTGSATESNNMVLRGVIDRFKSLHPHITPRLIISAIEHQSVYETARDLEDFHGVEVVRVPVDSRGVINLSILEKEVNERTALVSVMYGNSEMGTIEPIQEIGRLVKLYRDSHGGGIYPLFHTDAVQAYQCVSCDVDDLGVDFLTLSAHKIYGPKGISALYVRSHTNNALINGHSLEWPLTILAPIMTGGRRQMGLRAGTDNVPSIVGFGAAVALNESMREREIIRVRALRNRLWEGILKCVPSTRVNGIDPFSDESNFLRLPHNLNVCFPGRASQEMSIALDLAGLSVSVGAACSARVAVPSYVIAALGGEEDRSKNSIRFSLGRGTSESDVEGAIEIIEKVWNRNKVM